MEESFTEITLSYHLDDLERMEKNSYTTRLQPPQSPPKHNIIIIFIFSCRNTRSQWILSQDSPASPRFLGSIVMRPVISSTMCLDLDTLLASQEEICTDIEQKLESWLWAPTWRKYLARFAIVRAFQKMICKPQEHDAVFIDVSVIADWTSVFHEDRWLEFVAQMSAGDSDRLMIPALDSSIEALEKKGARCDGTCAICMDDYERGCEVTCMPCSHLFHGGCIEEWLRTSHYCPICRFKMPTSCEDIVDCSSM